MHMRKPIAAGHARRGVTTVEFALTAPLLFLICFAGIEFSRVNMLTHTAAIAATEGARQGMVAGATAEECYTATTRELEAIGVVDATVLVSPDTITDDTKVVTVGVSIPLGGVNGYVTPRYFMGNSVLKVVSVTRETQSGKDSESQAGTANGKAARDIKNGKGRRVGKGNKKP